MTTKPIDVLHKKMLDTSVPSAVVESIVPDEAGRVEMLDDDVLSELNAIASTIDLPDDFPPATILGKEDFDPETRPLPMRTTRGQV